MSATCQRKKKALVCANRSFGINQVTDHPFPHRFKQTKSRHQDGTAAIEFALVFPLFFLIFYGIITYGLIMVAQQSVTLAAAEGARAALRHAATEETREENAQAAAKGAGSVAAWLGTDRLAFTGTPIDCPYATGAAPLRCYSVTVGYPYSQFPLVPLLLGPLMQLVVPANLTSTAIVQID